MGNRNNKVKVSLSSMTLHGLKKLGDGIPLKNSFVPRGEICGHAVGVEYSTEAIFIAKKAKVTHKTDEKKRMRFICDDVEDMKFNEAFDRIFMPDMVEYLCGNGGCPESAGINRHRVGDERALHERSS